MTVVVVGYPYSREQDHYSSHEVICPHSSVRSQKCKVGAELLQHSQCTATC